MEQADIQEVFLRFAAPLAGFAVLGGRKTAVEELARNLWMALLAGDDAEQQLWHALAEADSELCDTVRRCYTDEMKPRVSDDELAALRERYWNTERRHAEEQLCLDQFLKFAGVTDTGGQAKRLIQAGEVTVNGEVETRRRRKLTRGDVIEVGGSSYVLDAEFFGH